MVVLMEEMWLYIAVVVMVYVWCSWCGGGGGTQGSGDDTIRKGK